MGAIRPSKQPKAKTVTRKDNPNEVDAYAEGKWIQEAIKPQNKGALRESLGVKKGQTIPAKKLEKAASAPGKLGQRACLAKTLKGLGK